MAPGGPATRLPVLPDRRRRGPGDAGLRRRPGRRVPRHQPAGADPPAVLSRARTSPRRPTYRGRRRAARAAFDAAAELAARAGIAESGYRIVTNIGPGAASPSTTCTSICWAAGRSRGRPGEAVAPGRCAALGLGCPAALGWPSPPRAGGRPCPARPPAPPFGRPRHEAPAVADHGGRAAALGSDGLRDRIATSAVPFRPPESPLVAAAPREVFQVVLPDDPVHGYLVIYAFPDDAAAATAAQRWRRTWAAAPAGSSSRPTRSRVIRQVGTTVIVYSWSPAELDRSAGGAWPLALATVGIEVPISAVGRAAGARAARPAARPARTGQRLVDGGPGADLVALHLEGVGAREVGVGPEAPAATR